MSYDIGILKSPLEKLEARVTKMRTYAEDGRPPSRMYWLRRHFQTAILNAVETLLDNYTLPIAVSKKLAEIRNRRRWKLPREKSTPAMMKRVEADVRSVTSLVAEIKKAGKRPVNKTHVITVGTHEEHVVARGTFDATKVRTLVSAVRSTSKRIIKIGCGYIVTGEMFIEHYTKSIERGVSRDTVAMYSYYDDTVSLFPEVRTTDPPEWLIAHELGHRLWFKFLQPNMRGEFTKWHTKLKRSGKRFITRYARKNACENFAEMFAAYVTRGVTAHEGMRTLTSILRRAKVKTASTIIAAFHPVASLPLGYTIDSLDPDNVWDDDESLGRQDIFDLAKDAHNLFTKHGVHLLSHMDVHEGVTYKLEDGTYELAAASATSAPFESQYGDKVYIEVSLATAPGHRRKGLAKDLLDSVIDYARDLHDAELVDGVLMDVVNAAAIIPLAHKLDFKCVSKAHNVWVLDF